MGRITSGVGLISGLDTASIIAQLIALEARPIELIEGRIGIQQGIQTALVDLSAKLLALQSSKSAFTSPAILNARTAASSHPQLIRAEVRNAATLGSYSFLRGPPGPSPAVGDSGTGRR